MSLFPTQTNAHSNDAAYLATIRAGRIALDDTTATSLPQKGALTLLKSHDDGLLHLHWKNTQTNALEEDLILFPGDAKLHHIPQCADGFAFRLQFATGRRLLFWSQEPRKKNSSWDDVSREKELLDTANAHLTGEAPPAASAPAATGFGGMTHSELMAMLSGAGPRADSASAAPAAAEQPEESAPAPEAAPEQAPPPPQFSAESISSVLGSISAAPAPSAAPAAAAFSAENISSILSGIAPPAAPISINSVLDAAASQVNFDQSMEQRLAEHLPQGGAVPESAAHSLSTPQLQQAAAPSSADETAEQNETTDAKEEDKMEE